MGIGPGSRVIEAGTGSGSFTTALAHAVGDEGHIYTYEIKESTQNAARKTLETLGFSNRVDFFVRDIKEGFDQNNVDAIFLDVSNPFDYFDQVRAALKPGGFFGCIVPTTNQVIQVLVELRRKNFAFIEVCDVSVRFYKTEPTRLCPTDRMISHTGYLIFARKVDIDRQMADKKLLKEIGYFSLTDLKNEDNSEDGNKLFEE